MFADGFFDEASVAETEAEPAATFAFTFARSFVPLADNGAGCFLFVDCRGGEQSGCVMEWDRDELASREPRWGSVGEMLAAIATSVETGQPCDMWRPKVIDGELEWEFDPNLRALDPWNRAWDLYMEFKSALYERGDPSYRPAVMAGGRDWSNFQFAVVENVLSNALYHRVPVQDWPPDQLRQVREDFTALRAALPMLSSADRAYFGLMDRLWQATLKASQQQQPE